MREPVPNERSMVRVTSIILRDHVIAGGGPRWTQPRCRRELRHDQSSEITLETKILVDGDDSACTRVRSGLEFTRGDEVHGGRPFDTSVKRSFEMREALV